MRFSHLSARVDGVVAGHEGGAGRRADGLDVVLLQAESGHGQGLQVGGKDVRIVPRNVIVACR